MNRKGRRSATTEGVLIASQELHERQFPAAHRNGSDVPRRGLPECGRHRRRVEFGHVGGKSHEDPTLPLGIVGATGPKREIVSSSAIRKSPTTAAMRPSHRTSEFNPRNMVRASRFSSTSANCQASWRFRSRTGFCRRSPSRRQRHPPEMNGAPALSP